MPLPGIVSVSSVESVPRVSKEENSHFSELESDLERAIVVREMREFGWDFAFLLRMMPLRSFKHSDHMT